MAEEDDTPVWEAQLDRALMNAAAILAELPQPESVDAACQLANTWLNVADSWTRRQDNELKYAKWFSDLPEAEEAEV